MRVLLDTHVLLWAIAAPEKLSRRVRDLLLDPATSRLVSVVSLWEIALKVRAGKLGLPENPAFFQEQLRRLAVTTLSVETSHVMMVFRLADYHRDPFDRLLIAQSLVENIPVLSADHAFHSYPIQVIW